MKSSANRIAWIDIARGLGIVLVVYGHVLRGLIAAHLMSQANLLWASDYTIYTFHMPLFFLLAGLQVHRSIARGTLPFLTNKLRTIAYPYLLWSLFQGGLQLMMPGILNSPRSPWTLLTILWHPIAQFWFLYILFLCHLLAFLTHARRWKVIPLLAVCIVCAALASHGTASALVLPAMLAHWFIFYAAGILLSHRLLLWRPGVLTSLLSTIGSALALGVCSHVGRVLSHANSDAPASWPASIAGIMLILSLSHLIEQSQIVLARATELLGSASLTIYIFHILAAAGTRIALRKLNISQWEPQLVLGTLIGVVAPLLLHLWLHNMNLLAPLGLGAPHRKSHSSHAPLTATSSVA